MQRWRSYTTDAPVVHNLLLHHQKMRWKSGLVIWRHKRGWNWYRISVVYNFHYRPFLSIPITSMRQPISLVAIFLFRRSSSKPSGLRCFSPQSYLSHNFPSLDVHVTSAYPCVAACSFAERTSSSPLESQWFYQVVMAGFVGAKV